MKYKLFYKHVVPFIEFEPTQLVNLHIKDLIELFYKEIGNGTTIKDSVEKTITYYKTMIEGDSYGENAKRVPRMQQKINR